MERENAFLIMAGICGLVLLIGLLKNRKRGSPLFPFFKQQAHTDAYYQSLLDNLMQTQDNLNLAYQNFENATEPELIDS